jgi:hypothetical protein
MRNLRAIGSAFAIGLVGLVLCVIGALADRRQLFVSDLFAFLFWNSLSQGGMAVLMLYQLTGGGWGYAIHRPLLAMTRTLPLMALLFIPLGFGLHALYLWAEPGAVAHDALLRHKTWYLNAPFFLVRAALYFAVQIVLALTLSRWLAVDRGSSRRLQRLSAGGLVLYALIASFAAFDWIMSLTPHWYSTTFGLRAGIGQMLAGFAFATAIAAFLAMRGKAPEAGSPRYFHDLGNLLLMFVMLWMYLAFMQYLIIWIEDLPHEIDWFVPRVRTNWRWLALGLVVFQFGLPFFVLLSRRAKRTATVLGSLAAVLVLVHGIDIFWLIAPTFRPRGFRVTWTDLAALLGIGGIWCAVFLWQFEAKPILASEAARHG